MRNTTLFAWKRPAWLEAALLNGATQCTTIFRRLRKGGLLGALAAPVGSVIAGALIVALSQTDWVRPDFTVLKKTDAAVEMAEGARSPLLLQVVSLPAGWQNLPQQLVKKSREDTSLLAHEVLSRPQASSVDGPAEQNLAMGPNFGSLGVMIDEADEALEYFEEEDEIDDPQETEVPEDPFGEIVVSLGPEELAAKFNADLSCLAQNIYFEARSEPKGGKLAVAHVVMNRVSSRRFPDSVCEVVRQGGEQRLHYCQFSWWCDGKSDEPTNLVAWMESLKVAKAVYWRHADDPTGGAMWYHADYVSPHWTMDFDRGPKIGRHIFYRSAKTGHRAQVATNPE